MSAEEDARESGSERSAKDLNNEWSAENRYWGDDFIVRVRSQGNEAEGEVPHTNATMLTLPDYLGEQDGFTAKNRPESPEEVSADDEQTRRWKTNGEHSLSDGVTTTLTLRGPTELIDSEFDALAETVGEALPDDWEVA